MKVKTRSGGFPVKKKGKAFARKVYLFCQRKRVGQTISRAQVAELGNALFLSAFDKKFSRIEVDLAQFKFFAERYFGVK